MPAWVVVARHPYYALTDDEGRFRLPDLPVGPHVLEVWHEVLGTSRSSRRRRRSARDAARAMIRIEVYGKRECCLCDEVKATLLRVRRDLPFELREIDIESTPELYAAYKERIPLVFVNGRLAFKFRVDEAALRRRLIDEAAAHERARPRPGP